MNLWLDDERDPSLPNIQKGFGAHGDETWVKTVPEAISYISSGNVQSISLDHDLGTEQTGYDLAKYIERGAFDGTVKRMEWRVHSANPAGSLNIMMALRNADRFWDKTEGL